MDIHRRAKRAKRVFYEWINPMKRFGPKKFVKRYRLNKATVRELARQYERHGFCSTELDGRGGGLNVQERMCLALRYFATGANYSIIGDFQGVSKATVSRSVREVAQFLYTRQQDYITFPMSWQDRYQMAQGFFNKYKEKPYCIGCVDGTHIPLIAPTENDKCYFNRKQYYSLNVMNSDIFDFGENGNFGKFFLLGDSGYALKPFLYTPILRPTNRKERKYNHWHRSTRSTVEGTIGILKQRWRCIDQSGGYLHHDPVTAGKIIVGCCCLHNLARDTNMPPAPPFEEEDEDADRPQRPAKAQPRKKRAEIAGPPVEQIGSRAEYIANNF